MTTDGTAPRAVVDVTADDALGTHDLTDLMGLLARREVSPAELRLAAVDRARRADARLNAVTTWIPDGWVADVEVDPDAPFAGIPTLVKDNEELIGLPTSQGSWAVPDRPATASWPWSRQFMAMGAVPIAKTTLPEFGLTASTESSRFGVTRNPWHTDRSAGGSSGGSAALVAAGVVPLAHANDGGGSIRIPASCCGLVGLKPSRGRIVDLDERAQGLPVPITTQGVVTRTVRDTARYFFEAERVHANPYLPRIGLVEGPGTRRLRIGLVVAGIRDLPVDPDIIDAVRTTGRVLDGLGHRVEETPAPVEERFGSDFLLYWAFVAFLLEQAGGRLYGEGFDRRRTEQFTTGLARLFRQQAARLPGALRRLRRMAAEHERIYSRFDVLVTPVLGHEPPPLGYLGPDVDFRTHLVRLLRYTSFTPVQNVSGSPGISLPLGRHPSGVPMGIQLGALYGNERILLELAYELEAARGWPTRPC